MVQLSYTKNEVLLSTDNLSVKYDKVIFSGVSFQIQNIIRPDLQQGQVVGILGASGIGKTQLLRCLAGLQNPTSGFVSLINGPVKPGQVGIVFQNYPTMPHRTIESNLRMVCSDEQKCNAMLEMVGLLDKKHLYPSSLSGGQLQRVAIVQQLLNNEKYLLLDEPFSGLDPLIKKSIIELLRNVSLKHTHNTMILTTHDIFAALQICDTIHILGSPRVNNYASLVATYDLAAMGLSWRGLDEVRRDLMDLEIEIESKYFSKH